MTMEAEGAGEEGLTFTFPSLADARFLVLHIEGRRQKGGSGEGRGRDGCFRDADPRHVEQRTIDDSKFTGHPDRRSALSRRQVPEH